MHDLEDLKQRLQRGDLEAARTLGRIRTDESVAILLEALESASGVQRRGIIQALPVHPSVEPILFNLLRTDFEYGDGWHGAIHTDILIKLPAFGIAKAVPAIREWVEKVLTLDPDYRFYAAEGLLTLSDLEDVDSLPIIRACLRDEDKHLRSAAVHAAGKFRDVASVPVLLELLSDKTTDPGAQEWLICDAAADALGKIGDERAIAPIRSMIERGETGIHPSLAIHALGKLSEAGFDAVLEMLEKSGESLRRDVIYTLGLIGRRRAVDPLLPYLHHDDEQTRSRTVEALGLLEDQRALPTLIDRLQNDPSPAVRHATIFVLTRFNYPQVVDALLMALDDESPWVLNAAIQVLGDCHEARAVDKLISLLDDHRIDPWHHSVGTEAAGALRKFDTPETRAALEEWQRRKKG